mmetsp:Transcript_22426/g.52934  ORF Transcript_22426/g.52934 Transcript_22426/m.52934 type:complete len:265 (+) Transcript_22426:196-990(+)
MRDQSSAFGFGAYSLILFAMIWSGFEGGVGAFSLPKPTACARPLSALPCTDDPVAWSENEVSLPESRRDMLRRAKGAFVAGSLGALSVPLSGSAAGAPAKSLSEEYRQGTAALADMDELAPVPREAYKKLPSGVIIADLRPGKGEDGFVKEGSRVNLQWVLRKSNGYFVDSSQVAYDGVPFIFTVGDGTAIAGVDEGVRGMSTGSVRRLLIPPSLAYVDGLEDGKPGPMPVGFGPRQQMRRVQSVRKDVPGEYIYLEVQVTRVR